VKRSIKAFFVGARDGFEQGPDLRCGMSYSDERTQEIYDAATYLGCGAAVILRSGWFKP